MRLTELSHWATSRGGNAIALHHSEDALTSGAHPLVIVGGVHGDEPEGVALAEGLLTWLKNNSAQVPWVLIPCLNPDGYQANTRTNAAGVDLNRNYPARSWSPDAKEPRYSPGPHPGSEPEVQAMVRFLQTHRPRLVIHCHSWHPCIVMTGEAARTDSEILARVSGYKLQETIGYDTPGSLSQYGWFDHKIPIICIEEQEGVALETVWPRFAPAWKEIMANPSQRGAP